MTLFSVIDDIITNWFLFCELHTNHLTQSMTSPIAIISQEISQIPSLYHIYKSRYQGVVVHSPPCTPTKVEKKCTLKGLNSITNIKTPTKCKNFIAKTYSTHLVYITGRFQKLHRQLQNYESFKWSRRALTFQAMTYRRKISFLPIAHVHDAID